MKRTSKQFSEAYGHAMRMLKWNPHKTFWIVPKEDDYGVSCFEPNDEDLPEGTKALKLTGEDLPD